MEKRKIALTGGIATGKSTVAQMFAQLGAAILDADRVARQVVEPGTPCWRQLYHFLGEEYFEPGGELKRAKLRQRIISDAQCRSAVNSILHPEIIALLNEQWEKIIQATPDRVVIFDIPLLFEAHLDSNFDIVLLVYAPPDTQVHRLMDRERLSPEQAVKTLSFQLPIDSKKAMADVVIDNSEDLDTTFRQVKSVWERLNSS